MEFTSTYALLDVTKGRHALKRHVDKGGIVRVTIEATIRDVYGSDDGTSREFIMDVHSIKEVQP